MPVLLEAVDKKLERSAYDSGSKNHVVTKDVLYADDTMLVATSPAALQLHLDAIIQTGRAFGLALNASKTILLRIRSEANVAGPDGNPIACKDHAVYLGGLLSADGIPRTEVTRRLGEARGAFDKICTVWNHANMCKHHKTKVLDVCIFSKLLYGLESCMLLKADRDRLDSFQAKCLRRIHKIPPAYVSRISNATVRSTANVKPLSVLLLRRQLQLYGKLAAACPDSLPRSMVFETGVAVDTQPRDWASARARGRPRLQWTKYMHARALEAAGSDPDRLQSLLQGAPCEWRKAVEEYCR